MTAPVRGVSTFIWTGSQPTDALVAAGDIWLDTASYVFKRCASIGPVVWTTFSPAFNSVSRITSGVETTDDVLVNSSSKGLVLKDSANPAHYWRVQVSTLGVLTTTDLGTTKP